MFRCVMLLVAALMMSAGCVTIDKEAVEKLVNVAADGEMTVRDPTLIAVWRTDIGLVLKVEGVDGKGEVGGELNPATLPSEPDVE